MINTKSNIFLLKDRINELDYRLIVSHSKAYEGMLAILKQMSKIIKEIERDIKEMKNESNTRI
jgi:hypothetical protein